MEEETANVSKSPSKRSSPILSIPKDPGLSGIIENLKSASPTLSAQFNNKLSKTLSIPVATLSGSPDKRSIDIPMPNVRNSGGHSAQSNKLVKDHLEEIKGVKSPRKKSSPVPSITKDPYVYELMENFGIASQPPSSQSKKTKSPSKRSPVTVSPGSPTKRSLNISIPSVKSSSVKHDSIGNTNKIKENEKAYLGNEKSNEINLLESFSKIEPKGKLINDQVDELNKSLKELSKNLESPQSPALQSSIKKISDMSKTLTNEAEALRKSLRLLSKDLSIAKQDQNDADSRPYLLFLIELIINSINMKCECFEVDCINLVVTAEFLGKPPIILYDNSFEEEDDLKRLNMGKSALFAMTYERIRSIKDFTIKIQVTKQPPCSDCVMKIAEANLDYTDEFRNLREKLCTKWSQEKSSDNLSCTTSMPLKRNLHYLKHRGDDDCEPIGVIEVSVRMSFLGEEITTTFCGSKGKESPLRKNDDGVSLCTCQDVEMDVQGNVLLNEDVLVKKKYKDAKPENCNVPNDRTANVARDDTPRYNEIYTKMNENELKIRVPKTKHSERTARYDKIHELCECESTAYNTSDQIQFQLPKDLQQGTNNTYTSDIKYTYNACDISKDRRIVNVTPTNCPVPVDMRKVVHPLKDVFILKIGKKLETADKKTDLEIELVTPKGPTKAIENVSQQCSSSLLSGAAGSQKLKKSKKGKKTGLGEFRIRDLNDEINKLMREKRHWEVQIKALGGPDHARVGPKMLDQDGKEVPGNRGYKYFGAAKDLPGVRELFEQEPPAPPRRTRADLMRDVDADYYGYRDDDDGLLIPLEREAEKEAIARAVDEWKRNKEDNGEQDIPEEENIYPEDPDDKRIEDEDGSSSITAHVAVPSQKDIEEALLRKKKQELLERYGCLDVKIEES
ncbi:uncharacterized protein LOC121730991 isoform X2 [Aricia agestis]|uniref:uncharacterized protein LOC121730991 isoform X2 n=1 Tax=Aricia agestis TaxID=91739 RepID=UPI001C20215A|nr:uncharacterized protein LOC121730991 isoform X2 [Aricia agestis]